MSYLGANTAVISVKNGNYSSKFEVLDQPLIIRNNVSSVSFGSWLVELNSFGIKINDVTDNQ